MEIKTKITCVYTNSHWYTSAVWEACVAFKFIAWNSEILMGIYNNNNNDGAQITVKGFNQTCQAIVTFPVAVLRRW